METNLVIIGILLLALMVMFIELGEITFKRDQMIVRIENLKKELLKARKTKSSGNSQTVQRLLYEISHIRAKYRDSQYVVYELEALNKLLKQQSQNDRVDLDGYKLREDAMTKKLAELEYKNKGLAYQVLNLESALNESKNRKREDIIHGAELGTGPDMSATVMLKNWITEAGQVERKAYESLGDRKPTLTESVNDPDTCECPMCGGKGYVNPSAFTEVTCLHCEGEGKLFIVDTAIGRVKYKKSIADRFNSLQTPKGLSPGLTESYIKNVANQAPEPIKKDPHPMCDKCLEPLGKCECEKKDDPDGLICSLDM